MNGMDDHDQRAFSALERRLTAHFEERMREQAAEFTRQLEEARRGAVVAGGGGGAQNGKTGGPHHYNGEEVEELAPVVAFPTNWRAIIMSFMETTSMHGINRAFQRGHMFTRKVFWTVVFLGALAATIYLIMNLILDYLDYASTTQFTVSYVRDMVFPTVTFCNLNIASMTAMQKAGYGNFTSDVSTIRPAIKKIDMATYYHQNRTDFIHDCTYSLSDCTSSLTNKTDNDYGMCYQFNGDGTGTTEVSSRPGAQYGLRLKLNIQQDDYLPSTSEAGVLMQVHDSTKPFNIDEQGFGLEPGRHYRVSVRRISISNLKSPYGTCKDTVLEDGETYSLSTCYSKCRDQEVISQCGCRPSGSPIKSSSVSVDECSVIHNSSDDICRLSVEKQYASNKFDCNCPEPCSETTFQYSISAITSPSNAASATQLGKLGVTANAFASNFILVDVFYEELNFWSIEQQAADTPQALFGNIGGNLGLFIGASWLTILEFMELGWWWMKAAYLRRKSRKGAVRPAGDAELQEIGTTKVVG